MNARSLLPAALAAAIMLASGCSAADVTARSPEEAARLAAEGRAVLIDVREPAEWESTGVATPAHTLALSDLRGDRAQWKPFLEANRDKELILYCRSGNRSGQAAALLASEGYHVSNAGGLRDWIAAGLPVRKINEPRTP